MKRLLSVITAVTVSTAAAVVVSAAPAFAVIRCDTTMTGNIPGNVIVPSGATCILEEANVAGNVNVRQGGTLEVLGSQLTRSNITANAPAGLYIDRSIIGANVTINRLMTSEEQSFPNGICGTTIGANLTFSNSNPETTFTIGTNQTDGEQPAFEGQGGCSAPNTIHGSVTLTTNQGEIALLGNHVGGNVTASKNTGGGEISGNTIKGSLTCANNSPPLFASNNSVTGNDSCGNFNP